MYCISVSVFWDSLLSLLPLHLSLRSDHDHIANHVLSKGLAGLIIYSSPFLLD